jgi:hypothetical protein
MFGICFQRRQFPTDRLSDRLIQILAHALGSRSADSKLAQARVMLTYLYRHGRLPDLDAAPRFTEMVQRRKLDDRDPHQRVLMDKIAAKRIAADVLGPEWATPTLWEGAALPQSPPFQTPAILKARHGCNQYEVLRHAPSPSEWQSLRMLSERWMAGPYGKWLDEWAYEGVPRALIAEPLLGDGHVLPLDYKIYVFGGRATHVQVHVGRATDHRWILHDRAFHPLVAGVDKPAAPRSLDAMLAAAEALADGLDFLRIDFFEIDGRPRFGEFCLYPGSGLDPFAADWIDLELGGLWHAARENALVWNLRAPTGGQFHSVDPNLAGDQIPAVHR